MNLFGILQSLDVHILNFFYISSPYTIYLSYFTELTFLFYFLFAYFFMKKKNNRWRRIFFYLIIGYLFIFALKIIFNRERPYPESGALSIMQQFEKSFPSGHAFLSAMLINFVPNKKWKKYFIIYPVAVSLSLIIIGAHYPTDVLVGFILGYFFPKCILPEQKITKYLRFLK